MPEKAMGGLDLQRLRNGVADVIMKASPLPVEIHIVQVKAAAKSQSLNGRNKSRGNDG